MVPQALDEIRVLQDDCADLAGEVRCAREREGERERERERKREKEKERERERERQRERELHQDFSIMGGLLLATTLSRCV